MLRYMTVDEIRILYRRPTGTIHRLASTDRWRRCDDRRPALYGADDVQATFDRLARDRLG